MKHFALYILLCLACDVFGQNKKPYCNDDYLDVGEGAVANVDVLENDDPVDGDRLTITSFKFKGKNYKVNASSYTMVKMWDTGILSVNSVGFVQFWPSLAAPHYLQLPAIHYVANDGRLGRDTGTVFIRYWDSAMVVKDTNNYCIVINRENGMHQYCRLVRRIELGYTKYYYDAGIKLLIPLDKETWWNWYRRKIKPGAKYYKD